MSSSAGSRIGKDHPQKERHCRFRHPERPGRARKPHRQRHHRTGGDPDLHGQSKARATDYIDGFGLTAHEYELVRTLPDSAHCFLIKHGADSVVARLNLTGERDLLTILSGRERTVRLLDEIRASGAEDPADWLPLLLERA